MRIKLLGFLILIVLISFFCSTNNNKINKNQEGREVPVLVAKVKQKSMPIQIETIGLVEASSSVSVKAQVSGELKQIHFNEGDEVREGSLLFTIDSEPYEAALRKAQATLAKDRVLEAKAREDVIRYADLAKKEYITKEQYDQIIANADSLKEIVKADEALVQAAQIDVDRCKIRAPISGRTGEIKFKVGNLIRANDERALVIINKIKPVYVKFALPEKELINLREYMNRGKIKVEAIIPSNKKLKEGGELFFIDNAVDNTTGTIQAKAIFDNKEEILWPGQYVDVRVILAIENKAIVIPSQAVQTGQEGDFVFIVNGNRIVEDRKIEVARKIGEEVVVSNGLKAGEVVVTDGQMQLITGVKVKIKNEQELGGVIK